MQNKKQSLIEACTNTVIGFLTNLVLTPFVYYFSGIEASYTKMGIATVIFTILGVIRGYLVRRFFNKFKTKRGSN